MDKGGLGHVEVVLSVVLFIGFVFSAFFFFNPLDTEKTLESSIDYALSGVQREISSELVIYSIIIEDENIIDPVSIPLSSPGSTYKVRVEDDQGEKLPAFYSSGKITIDTRKEKFLLVKFSEFFDEDFINEPGNTLNPTQYSISSSFNKMVWGEKRIKQLVKDYEEDYNLLRDRINLPSNVDFAVYFKNPGESVNAIREIPEGIEVFGINERNEIILSDGSSEFSELRVLTW